MNAVVNIESIKKQVRSILNKHGLGEACMAEHGGELHVFLVNEPSSNLDVHLATSDLEQGTGKTAQIRRIADLGPAERTRLNEVATEV